MADSASLSRPKRSHEQTAWAVHVTSNTSSRCFTQRSRARAWDVRDFTPATLDQVDWPRHVLPQRSLDSLLSRSGWLTSPSGTTTGRPSTPLRR